jgi:hypothetical protein
MKSVKSYSIIVCTLFLLQTWSSQALAQLTVGATIGTATRWSVPDRLGALGLGFNLAAKYKVWKGLVVGIDYGYFGFGPESNGANYKVSYSSYMGSLEYQLLKNKFKPYIGVDVGVYNWHTVTTIDLSSSGGNQDLIRNEFYFGFAPTVGANYALSERINLNANLKLNTVIIREGAPIGYASLSVGVFYTLMK